MKDYEIGYREGRRQALIEASQIASTVALRQTAISVEMRDQTKAALFQAGALAAQAIAVSLDDLRKSEE